MDTRCVVLNTQNRVLHRLRAYELTSARTLTLRDIKDDKGGNHRVNVGRATSKLLEGDSCYAFHNKASAQVKLGHSADVSRRWVSLEAAGGVPLQLVAIWHVVDMRAYERQLHGQFSAHRRLGEWFDAVPVLAFLTQLSTVQRAEQFAAER